MTRMYNTEGKLGKSDQSFRKLYLWDTFEDLVFQFSDNKSHNYFYGDNKYCDSK